MKLQANYNINEICGFNLDEIEAITAVLNADVINDFDFPDYGGLPKNTSMKFTSDQVDALQDIQNSSSLTDLDIFNALIRYGMYE